MNINRHNYEEYFILYMDNELSSEERRMVEDFVQTNLDLKDELDVLLQSKLIPESNIVFEDKEELMKNENGAFINLSNYEEWFTLCVDDELNPGQKNEVERFITANPELKKEFTLLQKTRLQPDEIVFPYKESLYKRTEKVRIIPIRWMRIAVAAILLFAISISSVVILNNNRKISSGKGTTTAQENTEQKTDTKNSVVVKKGTNNEISKKQNNQNISIEKKQPENFSIKKDEKGIANTKDDKPSNNLPQPQDNPNVKDDGINTGIAKVPVNTIENKTKIEIPIVTKPIGGSSPIKILEKSEPEPQYASLEEGQNKKSRGFFRKAVRFVEKTTKIKPANDDDRILIGGLAVKLN